MSDSYEEPEEFPPHPLQQYLAKVAVSQGDRQQLEEVRKYLLDKKAYARLNTSTDGVYINYAVEGFQRGQLDLIDLILKFVKTNH